MGIMKSGAVFLNDHRSVVPAKSKRIAKSCIYDPLLGFIKCKVQLWIKIGVIGEMIDGRRNDILIDCKDTSQCFQYSCCTQAMTCHALCTADIQVVCMIPENL